MTPAPPEPPPPSSFTLERPRIFPPSPDAAPRLLPAWLGFALGLGTLLLGISWYVLQGAALAAGARVQGAQAVESARALLEHVSEEVRLRLRTEAQLMSEDPRLKSTLATPGIDEATITDVLQDLRKQTSAELLAVLTPTARVRAVVGADYLKNLDLSTSSVVRAAQATEQPTVGTWVVADRVLDVSAKAIRFDNQTVAFLVVGAPLAEATLTHAHRVTGAWVALLVGGKVALAQPSGQDFTLAFTALAAEPSALETQEMVLAGHDYMVQLTDLKNAVPRARLAVVLPADAPLEPYERARNLAAVPVGVAVVFAAMALWRGRLFR